MKTKMKRILWNSIIVLLGMTAVGFMLVGMLFTVLVFLGNTT